jgi:hypothetical protein
MIATFHDDFTRNTGRNETASFDEGARFRSKAYRKRNLRFRAKSATQIFERFRKRPPACEVRSEADPGGVSPPDRAHRCNWCNRIVTRNIKPRKEI